MWMPGTSLHFKALPLSCFKAGFQAMASLEERCQGCLLGAMLGDALGAPWEGESQASVQLNAPEGPWDFMDRSSDQVASSQIIFMSYLHPFKVFLSLLHSHVEASVQLATRFSS